ncbi:hypothetical protein [Streptomyces spiralis]|uniref:hypothetical protein n=1 Tax=Streptomyces spiralis TaxID=66376 RepID=UPI00369A9044
MRRRGERAGTGPDTGHQRPVRAPRAGRTPGTSGVWTDVTGLRPLTPACPTSSAAGTNRTYVFDFDTTTGDGVRGIGGSGGSQTFTSIAEPEACYR